MLYIGVTILHWPERDVWKMTPYKILTLWGIHQEHNQDKYKQTGTAASTAFNDIDRAIDALGG